MHVFVCMCAHACLMWYCLSSNRKVKGDRSKVMQHLAALAWGILECPKQCKWKGKW